MSTTRLPELPEFDGWIGANDIDPDAGIEGFTAATVHAYGLAVWKAAMDHAMAQLAAASVDGCYADAENLLAALPLPEQGSPQ